MAVAAVQNLASTNDIPFTKVEDEPECPNAHVPSICLVFLMRFQRCTAPFWELTFPCENQVKVGIQVKVI